MILSNRPSFQSSYSCFSLVVQWNPFPVEAVSTPYSSLACWFSPAEACQVSRQGTDVSHFRLALHLLHGSGVAHLCSIAGMCHKTCLVTAQALPSPDEAGISLSTRIARLKAVKQQALAKKKEMAKELKAAQKKLKKVKGALSLLSDEDLNQAVADRQAAANCGQGLCPPMNRQWAVRTLLGRLAFLAGMRAEAHFQGALVPQGC